MLYSDLFDNVKSDIYQLSVLPRVFKRAKKLRSFGIMLNSIQNAMRDQITQQLGFDLDCVDPDSADEFDRKARSLRFNLEIIFRRLSRDHPRRIRDNPSRPALDRPGRQAQSADQPKPAAGPRQSVRQA